jgi:hypothetical protein
MDRLWFFIVYASLLWFCACRKDEPTPVDPFLGEIESITPATGYSGDTIRVFGRRFGTDPSNIRAFVNGKHATIVYLNDTAIHIIVPVRAGTGLVSLAGASGGASGPIFQFIYRARVEWYAGTPTSPGYADGIGSQSRFHSPMGLTTDQLGNLYVADEFNHRIRRVSPGGAVSTLSGDGQPGHQDGTSSIARFNYPAGLSYDPYANELYVADRLNHCIRKINQQGFVFTVAGVAGTAGFVDAPGASARLNQPVSVVFDPNYSDVYIGDSQNHSIRKLSLQQVVSTFAGDGTPGNNNGQGATATFNIPGGLLMDSVYRILVADAGNHNIRSLDRSNGFAASICGSGISGFSNGVSGQASFSNPTGICWFEDKILVADRNNHAIRMIFKTGEAITLAGDGLPGMQNGISALARFNQPVSIAKGLLEGEFFISDSGNHGIRRMLIE